MKQNDYDDPLAQEKSGEAARAASAAMKKEYAAVPPSMAAMETYGFSWMDFVTAIPSPLFVATTWKSNGKANACLQSWACFTGSKDGFFAVLSAVFKSGHFY